MSGYKIPQGGRGLPWAKGSGIVGQESWQKFLGDWKTKLEAQGSGIVDVPKAKDVIQLLRNIRQFFWSKGTTIVSLGSRLGYPAITAFTVEWGWGR